VVDPDPPGCKALVRPYYCLLGVVDPEWELDPKQIVFEQKVRCVGIWGPLVMLNRNVEPWISNPKH
jgi:hypothetical protein